MSPRCARHAAVLSVMLLALAGLAFSAPCFSAGGCGEAVVIVTEVPEGPPAEVISMYGVLSAEVLALEREGHEVFVFADGHPRDRVSEAISDIAESYIGKERFLDRESFLAMTDSGALGIREMDGRPPSDAPADPGFMGHMLHASESVGEEVAEAVRGFAERVPVAVFESKMSASLTGAEVSCISSGDRRDGDNDDGDDEQGTDDAVSMEVDSDEGCAIAPYDGSEPPVHGGAHAPIPCAVHRTAVTLGI